MHNLERPSHVLAALRAGEADLRNRRLHPNKQFGCQLKLILSQFLQRGPGNEVSLIETPLPTLGRVQRNWNDQYRHR
jgi:hypothetical protein